MASDRIVPDSKQRNPITYEKHRRQTFWQIYLPIIVFGVLVIVAIVLAILADSQATSKWSDISLIFMISLAMIAFLLIIVSLIFFAYYARRLLKETPYFFFTVQRYTYLVEIRVKKVSNLAVEPFLKINSYFAGARALRRK